MASGRQSQDEVERGEIDPRTRTERYFAQAFSNIQALVGPHAETGNALRVVCRGSRDWLAIASRRGSDGDREVAFGVGESFWGAVAGLGATLAKGGWKRDKYQGGG